MSFPTDDGSQQVKENILMKNTIEVLDDEKQNILTEILKCKVCFEVPKNGNVKICERGHHFCFFCHNKMKFCGICRGNLLDIRNFVVEQLVEKLGPILDLPNHKLPPINPPADLSSGSFQCLYCASEMPAFQMLPHLRARHSANLIDDVRSNPYSGRFSFLFDVRFVQDEKCMFSAQVSDMGLFTVEIVFSGLDFFGCVKMLAKPRNKTVMFRYQLVAKVVNARSNATLEFGVTDCPVVSYLDDVKSVKCEGNGLSIKGATLLEHIDLHGAISVFFSVWKKNENEKEPPPSMSCLPERYLFFKSDKKVRKNRNRNMRRKRLQKRLKSLAASEEKLTVLTESLTL